jgi:hypothetical protein
LKYPAFNIVNNIKTEYHLSSEELSTGAISFCGVVRKKEKSDMLARRQGRIDWRNSLPLDEGGEKERAQSGWLGLPHKMRIAS